jgi:pheromone shutdown protein TraB
VERCKNKDILGNEFENTFKKWMEKIVLIINSKFSEDLLQEMAGEYPQVSRILVDERDQ